LNAARETVGKAPVAGVKDRATNRAHTEVLSVVTSDALVGVIGIRVAPESTVYSDERKSYLPLAKGGYDHESVAHGDGEYARETAHTNGWNPSGP